MDINTKKLKKNAFRVTKKRGLSASRVRVPGGRMDAELLSAIQDIAQTYGDGTIHLTVRQGFEIPGIPFEAMPEVNAKLQPVIEGLGINQTEKGEGYPAAGTRNVTACVGNDAGNEVSSALGCAFALLGSGCTCREANDQASSGNAAQQPLA